MEQVREGHYYINKKSKKHYFVYKIAIDVSRNIEHTVVVYSSIKHPSLTYVRDLKEFKEKFEDID